MGAFSKASSMPFKCCQRGSNIIGEFYKVSSLPLKHCPEVLQYWCTFSKASSIPLKCCPENLQKCWYISQKHLQCPFKGSSIWLVHFPKHLWYPLSVVRGVPTLVQFSKHVQYPLSLVQRFPSIVGTFSKTSSISFKGTVPPDFSPFFFLQTTSPGPSRQA